MKYVIDSSVMVKWAPTEPDSDKALRLRDDLRKSVHGLISPDIFAVEASHALTRAERQGRIAVGQARALFLDILTTMQPPGGERCRPGGSMLFSASSTIAGL